MLFQGCNLNSQGNLSVEAGLVYKSNDVKPVARTEFYLLDDDLETILKNAKIKQVPVFVSLTPLQHFTAMQRAKKVDSSQGGINPSAELLTAIAETDNAIKPHIVATITTDFNGKGQFENVKPGKYYLMGSAGTFEQAIIWNLPIEIKVGEQSVTLDNKNSALIL